METTIVYVVVVMMMVMIITLSTITLFLMSLVITTCAGIVSRHAMRIQKCTGWALREHAATGDLHITEHQSPCGGFRKFWVKMCNILGSMLESPYLRKLPSMQEPKPTKP